MKNILPCESVRRITNFNYIFKGDSWYNRHDNNGYVTAARQHAFTIRIYITEAFQ